MQQKKQAPLLAWLSVAAMIAPVVILTAIVAGCGSSSDGNGTTSLRDPVFTQAQLANGRAIVTTFGCSDCHNRGKDDPSDPNWLGGYIGPAGGSAPGAYAIGPFHSYAANLTPDKSTGLGGLTSRQLFNSLRFGIDPATAPDAVITSTTPGVGNFPATPHYLAPPMPWPSIRHLSDDDIWSIVAYLQHGLKPVSNAVPEGTEPPDNWASSYTTNAVGPVNLPPFPAASEQFTP